MLKQSPYINFSREEWRTYRHDTPLTLNEAELSALRGFNESISITEVEDIYLPLSRLLNLYVTQAQSLHSATHQFLYHQTDKVPYIIGVSGSVAVGKSTTSRLLQTLLSRWPDHPKVALLSTDGFLFPNAVLESRGIMERKGFPESFDRQALINFLMDIKSGQGQLEVPVYSHAHYDITNEKQIIDRPDILIIEGLNILQTHKHDTPEQTYVSDFIDFNIFVDAETDVIAAWYLERFRAFRALAEGKPELFFHQFAVMPEDEAVAFARNVWKRVNEPNLLENILPFKYRADLILKKSADHSIESVLLRKL